MTFPPTSSPRNPRLRAAPGVCSRWGARTAAVADLLFSDLPSLLRRGDLLVVNDTRVLPARLLGRKPSGGQAEVLLLRREGEREWEALVRASKGAKPGTRVVLDEGVEVEVVESRGGGLYAVRVSCAGDADEAVERLGRMPLPPYIRRPEPKSEDRHWYQTVFARRGGAPPPRPPPGCISPPEMLRKLDAMGVERASVTLDVGLGTFLPVREGDLAATRCTASGSRCRKRRPRP